MGASFVLPRDPTCPERSFFLFGPRGTGKSTWLKQVLPEAPRLDLLDASLYLELTRDPHRLEALAQRITGWCSTKSRRFPRYWMKCIDSLKPGAGALRCAVRPRGSCVGAAPTCWPVGR